MITYPKRLGNVYIKFPTGNVVVGVVTTADNVKKDYISLSEYEEGVKHFQYSTESNNSNHYTVAIFEESDSGDTFICNEPIDGKWISELQAMGFDMDRLEYTLA